MSFLWYILIGIAAGAIAGRLTRGGGFGCLINLIVGIIGGILGGFLFGLLGLTAVGIIGNLIASVVGAVLFLWLLSLFFPGNHG